MSVDLEQIGAELEGLRVREPKKRGPKADPNMPGVAGHASGFNAERYGTPDRPEYGQLHPKDIKRALNFGLIADQVFALVAGGHNIGDACKMVGITHSKFAYWMRKPEMQERAQKLSEELHEELFGGMVQYHTSIQQKVEQYAEDALDHLYELMCTSDSEMVSQRSAIALVDRSPTTAKRTQVTQTVRKVNVDQDVLSAAVSALQEIASHASTTDREVEITVKHVPDAEVGEFDELQRPDVVRKHAVGVVG